MEQLANASVAQSAAKMQIALAAKFAKMNSEQGANVAKLLEAGQNNMQASLAAGLGQNLDISA